MACFYVRPAMVLALLGLAACGGGGGGGGDDDGVSTPPPITNLPANATTTLDGQSISADYEPDSITSVTAGPASTTLTTRDGQVVAVSLTAPNTNIAFDASNGDTIEQDASAVVATSSTDDAELALANGYQHQTFGVWIDGPPSGSGTVGAGSFGRKTTTLPTGTTATYRGTSAGYLQQGTDRYLTRSDITVTTDFATRAAINSTNTQASSVNGSLGNSEDYDFTATGTVIGSGFQATANTNPGGADISGRADGQFYGPTAEEVGGTFALQGPDGQYLGAFGARQ